MRIFAFILTIVISVVGFSACERASQIVQPAAPGTEDKRQEISVGVVLPLTGHLASAGELMKQGLDLALDEINNAQPSDAKLKFIIEDDTSTPEGAVNAFNKLIHQDGLSVILGPASSSCNGSSFPNCPRKPGRGN